MQFGFASYFLTVIETTIIEYVSYILLDPPAKPPRTYIDMEEDNNDEDIDDVANEVTFKTEVGIEIKQTPKAVPREDSERSDTASRRSILEKRNLFESTSPQSDMPDPAMLPLSQRKALFEKNKTIPKPIARYICQLNYY